MPLKSFSVEKILRSNPFRSRACRLWPARWPVACLALAGLFLSAAAQAEPYLLVAQDKIFLRVVEWRSGEGEYKDWGVIGGNYIVNDAGAVSIPLVGEVEAVGLTTQELSARIADLLQQHAGLPNKPFASVEIAQYGPIYIVGSVETPGQYTFNPDLTVMKAISLAGGLQKAPETLGSRIERDRIQAGGSFRDAKLDRDSQLMRQARLRAEMDGKDTFEIPEELAKGDGIEEPRNEELSLMKFRRVELQSKIAAAADVGELYTREIEVLGSKIEAQKQQITLSRKELTAVSSLVDKGITVSSRQLALERAASDADNKLLDLELALVRARQALEESKRDSVGIVNARNSGIQDELSEVARRLAKSGLEMQVAGLLMDEASYEGQQQLFEEDRRVTFHIVRRGAGGEAERIEAAGDTAVKPRDLIEVSVGVLLDAPSDATASTGLDGLESPADAATR